LSLDIKVQDLAELSPRSYLQFGGATLNDLSLQVARGFNARVSGVYVANPGYVFGTAGIARAAVITELDGKPVADLDDFQKVLEGMPDGDHARVRYFNVSNKKQSTLGIITVDRRWFPAERCTRDPITGNWPCTALPEPPAPVADTPATVDYPSYTDPVMNKLAPSLVFIKFDMPYALDGIGDTHYLGAGVVVDAKSGLIVADRDTVPVSMGDVRITFAGSLEVPGRVIYVNPLHNLAVIHYDPALLGKTKVASVEFATQPSRPGDSVKLVGYQPDGSLTSQTSQVASLDPALFPLPRSLRFRDTNLEVLSLVNAPGNVTGVLLDKAGRVTTLWVSFVYDDANRTQEVQRGIPVDVVQDTVRIARSRAGLRTLDVELYTTRLSQARKLGLSDSWAQKLGAAAPERREVLVVSRLTAGTPAEKLLQNGDLLLAIDGKPVASFRQVEQASQKPELNLTVLRNGAVQDIKVATVSLPSDGTERLLMWAGAILQRPHHAAAAERAIPDEGLLVGSYNYGSPASRYGLATGWRIIGVNGVPTPDMDSFIQAVQGLKDRDNVRLAVKNWDGTGQVITLKMDQRYWAPYEVVRSGDDWVRKPL
jgi:S1-C subfamily serine protease